VVLLAVTALAPAQSLISWVSGTSLVFLVVLGAVAARVGGAGVLAITAAVEGAVRRSRL